MNDIKRLKDDMLFYEGKIFLILRARDKATSINEYQKYTDMIKDCSEQIRLRKMLVKELEERENDCK